MLGKLSLLADHVHIFSSYTPSHFTWSPAHTKLYQSLSESLVHDQNLWHGVFDYDSLCQFRSFKTQKTQCIMETLKAGWVFGTEIVEDQGYIRHGSICCPRPQNHPRRRRSPRGCRPSPCASSEFWAGGGASATTGPWEFCV